MSFVKNMVDQLKQKVFQSVVENNLVYNTCWEDPAIDRRLLNINSESRLITLTSAGCNALNYLLDEPACIYCVDINPAQNALLELKLALFRQNEYSLLWNMFGLGSYSGASVLYHNKLRAQLSVASRKFWDRHIRYFNPIASTPSFYFCGTAGTFAYIIQERLKQKGLQQATHKLLDAESLKEQKYYFDEIKPHLWNSFSQWLLTRNATMTLLGVPAGQGEMIDNEINGGLPLFIQNSIEEIFTNHSLAKNYFWRVYLTGSYTHDCCPAFLKEDNFNKLTQTIDRLSIRSYSLIQFLKRNPGSYTHYNLLDHQDWMVKHQREKLIEEWELILKNSDPGTKILFRSAGVSRSFVPNFVYKYVHFKDEQTKKYHARDRVGTYGSTHLAVVDTPL